MYVCHVCGVRIMLLESLLRHISLSHRSQITPIEKEALIAIKIKVMEGPEWQEHYGDLRLRQ